MFSSRATVIAAVALRKPLAVLKSFRRTAVLAATLGVILAGASAPLRAYATENGTNEYPIGVNTVLPGLQPPPGETEIYDYFESYSAGGFANGAEKNEVPNFSLSVTAEVLRFVHTYKFHTGHFTLGSAFVQPFLNVSLAAAGHAQTQVGPADSGITPLVLQYASPNHNVFAYLGTTVFVPDGSYSVRNLANTGLNYVTVMPELALTWFVNPRVQTSIQFTQENHTTNPATNYHSGSSIDADYSLDYAPLTHLPKLHATLQGYAFQQFTNDTVGGQIVNAGNDGREYGIGPQIRYDFFHGGIALKYQKAFAVQNRPNGNRLWLQAALQL